MEQKLSAYERVCLARAKERPGITDFIDYLFDDFLEMKGDRLGKEDSDKWIGFLQMQLREQSIIVIEPAELEGLDTQNTVILAYYSSKYLDKLEELYKHQVMADVYNVFY